jgi:hypothetical protein
MNPDNWDWNNTVEGVTVGDPQANLTIPLSFDELDAIVEAAHAHRGVHQAPGAQQPPCCPHVTCSFTLKHEAHLVTLYAVSQ